MSLKIEFFKGKQIVVMMLPLCLLSLSFPGEIQGTLAPSHKIDLLIRGANGFLGDDVRNLNGNGQRALLKVGRKGKLFVRLQNEGEVPDTFKMRGSPGNRNFRLRYFHGGKNVTGAVRAGNFITPTVPAMAVLGPDFIVKIKVGKKARGSGKTTTIRIKGESTGAPIGDGTDVVKAKLRAR